MENKHILVTWDFSSVSDYALQHAIRIATPLNARVSLIHITKSLKEAETATKQLEIVAAESLKKYGYKPELIVREGNIFTTISEVADSVDAFMVFMGTHGMKGMQKITGSWALKVIAGSKMPFVVVQTPPEEALIGKLAFPVDFKAEDKQKAVWAVFLAKHFGTKIYLYKQNSDDAVLKNRIYSNVVFTKKVFESQGIAFEEIEAPAHSNFADETIKFAKSIHANAIMVTTTNDPGIQDYMFGATEQEIIGNKESITVICVTPKDYGKLPSFN